MPNLPPLPRPRLRRSIPVGGSVAPDAVEVAEPQVVEAAGLRWIHIEDPHLADREWLEARYDFH
ncbi:MAG: magnesium transporter CorA, partial [Chloroflexi bacterium]